MNRQTHNLWLLKNNSDFNMSEVSGLLSYRLLLMKVKMLVLGGADFLTDNFWQNTDFVLNLFPGLFQACNIDQIILLSLLLNGLHLIIFIFLLLLFLALCFLFLINLIHDHALNLFWNSKLHINYPLEWCAEWNEFFLCFLQGDYSSFDFRSRFVYSSIIFSGIIFCSSFK